jgi:hypothetical protein
MRAGLGALLALLVLACGGGGTSAPPPAFTLSLTPNRARLLPSARVTTTVVVTAEPGFAGSVDLEALGLAGDLTAQFQPGRVDVPLGGSVQAVLTIQAADTAPAAQRVVTVRGRAGSDLRTAELHLDIPAAKIFPVTTFLNQDQTNLTFLAYQDGNGPWTSVEGQGGLYKLPITDGGGRFGLIYGAICRVDDFTSWDVNGFFETTFDTSALYVAFLCNPQPGPPADTFALGGLLKNTGGLSGLISANSGLWSFDAGAPRYDLRLYRGLGDFVAATYPDLQTYVPSRLIVERRRDTQGPDTRDLDFSAEGNDPLPREPIHLPALESGETLRGSVQYQTAGGQTVFLGNGVDLAEYAPFPPAAAVPGDSYVYGFQASTGSASRTVVGSTTASPGALAPRLPSPFTPFSVPSAGTTRLRLGLTWDAIAPTPELHQATLVQRSGLEEAYWYASFSRRWLGEAPGFAWMPPDLTAIPGFDPHFYFRPGVGMQASMSQSGSQAAPGLPEPLIRGFARASRAHGSAPPGEAAPSRGRAFQVRRVPGALQAAAPPEYFYATRQLNLTP